MANQNEPVTDTVTTQPGDGRATEFRTVEGGGETRNGQMLLVEAYAAIWLILFAMLWLGFRKQRHLDARIAELERALGKHEEHGHAPGVSPHASGGKASDV
ncbi:MAG: hypothetical protein MUF54_11645 [Polyangiaceae bacterium]|nr:hypothetical protein [Polyangiaceae bacterium]